MRIGHGFDAHRFNLNRKLILGGVNIPFERGMLAHSDGDVVIHALCDALLGAAGLGDIGKHFPDSSAEFAGIDSRILLRRVRSYLRDQQLTIGNVDITIIAQAPRLAPYINEMRLNLATDLAVTINKINLKATTTERMGYIGRKEGIAVHAVALLIEQPE